MNIWASWCILCREEHEFLMELNKDQLLYLLQNLIFFESSLQKNIPLNSKLQLEVVLDVFK